MSGEKRLKAELMLFGLENDYFAYGTLVTKLKNGKYRVYADGETYYYTLTQLAEEWDQIDDTAFEKDLILDYYERKLKHPTTM